MEIFVILNIFALGVLAGTITGLVIGYAARRQKPEWSSMTAQDKRINIALVLFFTAVYIIVLSWYAMLPPAPPYP